MKKITQNHLSVLLLIFSLAASGQINKDSSLEEVRNWHHKDLTEDSIAGISTEKAYEFLKDKKSNTVIVAVIDSSMDILHEDLKDKIWVNKGEIENNGIDDDGNGYIDDINGWNFVGDLTFLNYEFERMLMNPDLVENKAILKEINKKYSTKLKEVKTDIKDYKKILASNIKKHNLFSDFLGKEDYTLEEVFNIKSNDSQLNKEIEKTKKWVDIINNSPAIFNPLKINFKTKNFLVEKIDSQIKDISKDSLYVTGQTIKTNYRASLGDDIENINDIGYGNNKSNQYLDEQHSTHVSGIIGANRDNNTSIKGISDNCLLMPIRVFGSGDEHDKDVALSIRYAVNNGAKIINASFGKHYSPYKEWVFDAIKYAEKNDVLIIISAGNDNLNTDNYFTYPNDTKDLKNAFSNNVITVGASAFNYSKGITTIFSNYGKINVDIFAPGQSIYSSLPNNRYGSKDGTSMAAPMVSGVAALIRSYYPNLTAQEVKQIILDSGTKIDFEVIAPGSYKKKVLFSELCASSSILNAYNAVKLAEKLSFE